MAECGGRLNLAQVPRSSLPLVLLVRYSRVRTFLFANSAVFLVEGDYLLLAVPPLRERLQPPTPPHTTPLSLKTSWRPFLPPLLPPPSPKATRPLLSPKLPEPISHKATRPPPQSPTPPPRKLVLEHGTIVTSTLAFSMTLPWPLDGSGVLAVCLPSSSEVAASLAWLMAESPRHLGVDVETDARNEVQLLQLSTGTRAVLLRWAGLGKHGVASRPGFDALCALMADPSVLKVGCELRKDALDLLYDSHLQVRMRGGRDVTPALLRPGKAGERGFVYGLVEAFNLRHGTGLVKDKHVTCSDWCQSVLTHDQLEYAALDAFMSFRLGCDKRLMEHAEVRSIDIVHVSPALADAGRLLRECQLQRDAARLPVASGFSEATWRTKSKDAELEVRMTHYENKLRRMDRVEVVFVGEATPWRAFAVQVYGKTAVLRPDPKPRKRQDNTLEPQLDFALGKRPLGVKSITVVEQDDLMCRVAYEEIKDLVAPRLPVRFATKHLLGGRSGAGQLLRWPAPIIKPLDAVIGSLPFVLNKAQAECVADLERGVSLSLTCGPPGTGKTTTIAAVAWSLATRSRGSAPLVAICTQQNVAALNVLHALRRIRFESVKLIISEGYFYEWHEAEYDPTVLPFLHVTGDTKGLPRISEERSVTLLTFGLVGSPALHCVLDVTRVGAVLVDEASQAWSGLALILDRTFCSMRRLHLFGDDRQLPPVLSPHAKSPLAEVCSLHVRSMFDDAKDGGAPFSELIVQHRMPLRLAAFISFYVYENKLVSAERVSARTNAVAWLSLRSTQGYKPGSLSPQNPAEAKLICRLVEHIEGLAALRGMTTVILTPYAAQRVLIENTCSHSSALGGRWDVKTVDSFQGREADIIIISMVRTDGKAGFLKDVRRANVMLSRAKSRLFIVGDQASWKRSECPIWRALALDFPVLWRPSDGSNFVALFS